MLVLKLFFFYDDNYDVDVKKDESQCDESLINTFTEDLRVCLNNVKYWYQ